MQFYLAMAQQGLAGKPGSQLNIGDMSSLFSPNLGLLTGTLTDTTQTDEDIYASVAPNIFRVRNNPDGDPIATAIVRNLENGFSLPQTLNELRKKVSGEDLKAYQNYAEQVSKEMGDVKSAFGKRKTLASEAGLPEPNASYDPTPKMANIHARLIKQSEPILAPLAKKYKDLSKDEQKKYNKANEAGMGDILKSLVLFKNPDQISYDRKNTLPEERYVQANQARQKIAAQEYGDVKNLLASSMQRNSLAGSPFMDEIMKRTIMKRLIENPGAINKLTNLQG